MSGVSGGSFDYGAVTNTLGSGATAAESALRDFSGSMDPNNAGDMIKMQMLVQKWSVAVNLESNMVKSIGDALKGVVQKVGG